jgi:histidinol dehydrogenase
MRIIATGNSLFEETFRRITGRGRVFDARIRRTVKKIVDDVARRGDAALFAYAKQLDQTDLDAASVEVSAAEWEEASARVIQDDMAVLQLACRRINAFHQRQTIQSWSCTDEDGVEMGQMALPLEKIGIYAPGGLAAYPSTVLMAAIPATIAGVKEILLVTPVKGGGALNPLIAAAARLSGVTRIFKIGGAQAIAALAYGTASVPRVDKIVGPGNAYVSAAKRMVYGVVAIDMIAGPSEVLIIADGAADASFIAADLLAQAEHDEMASGILLTPDENLARRVASEVDARLAQLPKQAVAGRSLEAYGAIVLTQDLHEALALANRFAPEHLELMVEKPQILLAGGMPGRFFWADLRRKPWGIIWPVPTTSCLPAARQDFHHRWGFTISSSGPAFCPFPLPLSTAMVLRPNILPGSKDWTDMPAPLPSVGT